MTLANPTIRNHHAAAAACEKAARHDSDDNVSRAIALSDEATGWNPCVFVSAAQFEALTIAALDVAAAFEGFKDTRDLLRTLAALHRAVSL